MYACQRYRPKHRRVDRYDCHLVRGARYRLVEITAEEAQMCVVSSVGDCSFDLHYTWCDALCTRGSLLSRYIVGPGKAYSSSNEVWETQWHCMTAQHGLLWTKMHYVLEPQNIENYIMRLFVDDQGSSCSLEKSLSLGIFRREDCQRIYHLSYILTSVRGYRCDICIIDYR